VCLFSTTAIANVLAANNHLTNGNTITTIDSSQIDTLKTSWLQGAIAKKFPSVFGDNKVVFSGYYRLAGLYRNFQNPYQIADSTFLSERVLRPDDGYWEPVVRLNIAANPTSNTSFYTDLFLLSPYNGVPFNENYLSLNLALNFYGNINTQIGTFSVRTGGIHWYSLSAFTLGQGIAERFSIYERQPWNGSEHPYKGRVQHFYNKGYVASDNRFGVQAFKGLIVEGSNLPQQFSFALVYGKTANNVNVFANGFGEPDDVDLIPHYSYGGKLVKSFKNKQYLAYNTFNTVNLIGTINADKQGFNIHTLSFEWLVKALQISGEAGMGRYYSPNYGTHWSPGFKVKVQSPKKYTGIPLDVEIFHLGKNFVNPNSEFLNTSIVELQANPNGNTTQILNPFATPLLPIGILANNRQGVNLETAFNFKRFKFSIGNSIASEISPLSNDISFGHRVNGLTISRFAPFAFNIGAYQHLSTIYRGTFELSSITAVDSITGIAPLKRLNTFEFQLKYQLPSEKVPVTFFYNSSYNSVQPKWSPVPVFSNKAYLRAYYHELELYYNVVPSVTLNAYYGHQTVRANEQSNLSPDTGLPRHQINQAVAIGTDILLTRHSALHLKQRWFHQKAHAFTKDNFKGSETSLELKVYF